METKEKLLNGGIAYIKEHCHTAQEQISAIAQLLDSDTYYLCTDERRTEILASAARRWEDGDSFIPGTPADVFDAVASMMGFNGKREADTDEELIACAEGALLAMADANYRAMLAAMPRDVLQGMANTLGRKAAIRYSGQLHELSRMLNDYNDLHSADEYVYFPANPDNFSF